MTPTSRACSVHAQSVHVQLTSIFCVSEMNPRCDVFALWILCTRTRHRMHATLSPWQGNTTLPQFDLRKVYSPLFIHYVARCFCHLRPRLAAAQLRTKLVIAPTQNRNFGFDFKCECKSLNLKLDFLAFRTLFDLFHMSFRCFSMCLSSPCAYLSPRIQLIYGFDSIVYTGDVRIFVSLHRVSKSQCERWARASEDKLSRVWKRQKGKRKFHE